jgi:pentatricopeptide repeat protein
MVNEGCQPNVVTYNALMSALVKNGEWNQTLVLFQKLRNTPGLVADTISYSVAISACSKGSKWQKAVELLSDMEAAGVKPNEFTYRPVLPR